MKTSRIISVALIVLMISAVAPAAQAPAGGPGGLVKSLPNIETPGGSGTVITWVVMVTVLSVAPALLVMVTCFTRIVVVLGLLRQALGSAQLPPNQVIFGLSLLMTAVVMAPTYNKVHKDAISPYLDGKVSRNDAVSAGETHIREFMTTQIQAAGNSSDVYLFLSDDIAARENLVWKDVPTVSLIPAFVVSELKVAFWMGFRIFLPFLVIDMLVATFLVSMGMLMLPPSLISLPFKLLLFVLADGWHLVVGTLMKSFG
ncbi:MAG: flagellar type III secretion system pore protein FliP [Phycisphaerae bacterium]|jgi:flagellar biosynthetic protein FliP|nr:flagellar type III secretion system pore protein FliP [Phycisphaerae bacterium]